MTSLVENALWIWIAGAIAFTMALIVYWETGSPRAQLGIVLVVLATATLLAVEHFIETPREAVARTLDEIIDAVRSNDMPAVLSFVAPSAATLRTEVETAMPLAVIDGAAILETPRIELSPANDPEEAIVHCRVFVSGMLKRQSMRGAQDARVQVTFVRQGDRWFVSGYTADKDWRQAVGR